MTALKALLIEDDPDDAELLVRELRRGGYDVTWRRVQTRPDLAAALRDPWDIVFSDWSMPELTAPEALEVFKQSGCDLPFIIVSGTIGEEVAVRALQGGAHDFVVKQRFARLLPAVERELREARARGEQRAIQAQLSISERMASVGVLAAGVAHEINNPLSSLLSNLELAREDLREAPGRAPADLPEQLDDAYAAATRIRTVVKDLKLFSHVSPQGADVAVDVIAVLESSLRMAATEVRHRARVERAFEEVPLVLAEESRLGQVFLNLIVNAAQALPVGDAGKHVIRLSTKQLADGRVQCAVEDTGSGIPPEVLERLFTPFFTTKPAGVGTGLGLSICKRIVTSFGGEIEVESEVGQGTRFTVTLQAAPAPAPALAKPATAEIAAVGRRARVLVIDDEELICVAVQRLLRRTHDVEAVQSVAQGVAKLRVGARFDVILCDLMMPDATGMRCFDEVMAIDPAQAGRMVFMTGGAFTPDAQAFLQSRADTVLEKPFDAASLHGRIAAALART